MKSLFTNIRFYVLVISVSVSIIEYVFIVSSKPPGLAAFLLTRIYALTAVVYLYIALLAGPLTWVFPKLPFRGAYLKARRALGVSVFYFSFLHARTALYDLLGGPFAIFSLDVRYQTAIILSSIAFLILFLMTVTSVDKAIQLLTFPRWKRLHRFVYLAGIFILVHATLIGSDFSPIWQPIPLLLYCAFFLLVVLHAVGLYQKYKK